MNEDDVHPGTISQEGHQRPSLRFLNRYVRNSVGLKWHDLGIELLDCDNIGELDIIEAEHPTDLKKCCTKMFSMWLTKQPSASWSQLIEALRQPNIQLATLAAKVERMLLRPKPKDKEKIGQGNINHFLNVSGRTPLSGRSGSSFGDSSSSSWNVGVGQATATGCGHGNMHSLERSVGSYGNYHHLQAQQQNHLVIKPSQQSFGSNSNTPPQLFNYVQPYYPSSGPSMGYIGLKNCVAGSRPNENTTTTTTLKSMEASASSGSRVPQLNGQLGKQAEDSGSTDVAKDGAITQQQMGAYQLCERLFDTLMHWTRTKDVRYLLVAQRSLKAVQNNDGDTIIHVAINNQQEDVVITLLDILPTLPASESPIVDTLNNFKQSPLHLSVITRQHRVLEQLLAAGANPLVCDRNGNTALHLSAHMGYPEAMKCLLERKTHLVTGSITLASDVLTMNVNGHTPAHLAALCGSIDCLKLLHQAGVNLDIQDGKSGRTALHYAVEKNDIALCGYLIDDVGGNVDHSDFSGNTPLHVAANLGNAQLINLLVTGGADRTLKNLGGQAPLDLAKQKGHNETVHLLENNTSEDHHEGHHDMEASATNGSRVAQLNVQLDKQADESGSTDVAEADAITQQQMAAYQFCERIFEGLMHWARTKDIRYLQAIQRSLTGVQNSDGDTVLHVAIINQQEDVVPTLLDILPTLPASESPIIDTPNNFKQSPLHLSVITRQHRVLEQLLAAGANPLVCDRHGNTALHLSAHMGYPEAMKCLLHRKTHLVTGSITLPSDVLIMNVNGHTPIHLAALCGSIDCLKLLHQAGANLVMQDGKSGRTALHYAVEKNNIALCGYLIDDVGSVVDQSDFSGNTPLHVAASLGNTQLINLLVTGGADHTLKNLEGETPLDLAKLKGHNEAVCVLENIASEDHHDQENSQQLVVQSTSVSTVTSNVPTSSVIKIEGNMNLDYMTRVKLSLLLDTPQYGKDWKDLCKLLGLEPLLHAFSTVSSPTQELLNYYEARGGTNRQLRLSLIEMCRNDCVTVIDNDTGHLPLPSNTQQQPSNARTTKVSCDSGISTGGPYPTRRKV